MNHPINQRLSVVASALTASAADAPRLARLAGFRGLLFDAWTSDLDIPDLTGSGRRDFRLMLSSQDQHLVGLRMDLGSKGISPDADVDRQLQRLDRAMEACAGLESPLLCIDLGPLPNAANQPKPRPPVTPQQAGLIIIPELAAPSAQQQPVPTDSAGISHLNAVMTQIGSLADRYSATIAFSSSLANFASLTQAVVSANCPWFGVDLDPVAVLRDDWSGDEIFSRLGSQIRHVRARDGMTGAEKRIKPAAIGAGAVNWPQLLALLDGAGYPGFVTVDTTELPDRAAAARAGADYFRNLPL